MNNFEAGMLEEAHLMSKELAKQLLTPIIKWCSGTRTPELELVTTAYMTAILGCAIALEEMFGEENIRPHMERARQEAKEFASATIH